MSFNCFRCRDNFSTQGGLSSHLRYCGQSWSRNCPKCDFPLRSKSAWTRHVNTCPHPPKTNSAPAPGHEMCVVCKRTFKSQESFRAHRMGCYTPPWMRPPVPPVPPAAGAETTPATAVENVIDRWEDWWTLL